MRRSSTSVLLLAFCGCNQVYNLDSTRLPAQDGSPINCPPTGQAPRFSPAVRQAVQQECTNYHFNSDGSVATATCLNEIYVGRRDEPLVKLLPVPKQYTYYSYGRPSPTEARVYARREINTPSSIAIATFDETSPGTWTETGTVAIPYMVSHRISTVFRGNTGDRVILIDPGLKQMTEYERDGVTWVRRGDPHALPTSFTGYVELSVTTDGLRAVYCSEDQKQLLYVDRSDLANWFGEPQPVEGAPIVPVAQLTEDCTRLYYDGLDSIFFSQQE